MEYKSLDYYPTTDKVAVNKFLDKETFTGGVWEPCCGEGHLVKELFLRDYKVLRSDIHRYGRDCTYGEDLFYEDKFITPLNIMCIQLDFLKKNFDASFKEVINIVTNPPYTQGRDTLFALKGIEFVKERNGKLALLLRSSFRHSQGRHKKIFKDNPYSRVYNYIERISLYKDGVITTDTRVKPTKGMIDYSWFVWDFTSGELDKNTKEYWI